MCRIIYLPLLFIIFTFSLFNIISGKTNPVPVELCEENAPIPIEFISENCTAPPCPLLRGTTSNANITFRIPADTDHSLIVIVATALGITVPFTPKDPNVCHNLLNSYCPLDENEVVIYHLEIPVLALYPEIPLKLKVSFLDEKNNTMSCFKIACQVVKKI